VHLLAAMQFLLSLLYLGDTNLYEICTLVVTAENKTMAKNSISSCKFEISRRGIGFARAG
jgi:hypothetical protein